MEIIEAWEGQVNDMDQYVGSELTKIEVTPCPNSKFNNNPIVQNRETQTTAEVGSTQGTFDYHNSRLKSCRKDRSVKIPID